MKSRFITLALALFVLAVLTTSVRSSAQETPGDKARLTASTAAPASADARAHDPATVARARAAFLKHMSSHRPMVRSQLAPPPASGGTTGLLSYNWSGFADAEAASQTVSSVSAEWVIPYVQCPTGLYQLQDTIIAEWIGIDGFSNGTVEQLGSATECFEGVPYYFVWYEMFPNGLIEEGTLDCINNNVDCPEPGDRIAASVTVTAGGNYTLSLTDFTRPEESFSIPATCAPSVCVDSSAEWIVERPAFDLPFGFQIVPAADFFQTGFSDGKLTSGGKTTKIEGFKDGGVYDLEMIDDTDSYLLDCVGQRGFGPQLLLTTEANACPIVSPSRGSFGVTWDASF